MAQEAIDLVYVFYENDEYSRQFPGKVDCVSIKQGIHKQKRLVLCNLHELFLAFKEGNTNVKILQGLYSPPQMVRNCRFIGNTLITQLAILRYKDVITT